MTLNALRFALLITLFVCILTVLGKENVKKAKHIIVSSKSAEYMPRVIFTVFAGREKYLEILVKYLDVLLEQKLLTTVHIWDFTRTESDKQYVLNLARTHEKYTLFAAAQSYEGGVYGYWKKYYHYYAATQEFDDRDILIKCDDDLVYIDLSHFKQYITEITTGDKGLYFANIVNNDVMAYIQTKYGVHGLLPPSEVNEAHKNMMFGNAEPFTGEREGWFKKSQKAIATHRFFLNNTDKFVIKDRGVIGWGSRVSINFFAATVKTTQKYYNLFKKFDNCTGDDEYFLTAQALRMLHVPNLIVTYFPVVHFSFMPQYSVPWEGEFLPQYHALAPGGENYCWDNVSLFEDLSKIKYDYYR